MTIKTFNAKTYKTGNSIGITIPHETATILGIKEGQICTFSITIPIHRLPKQTAENTINNPNEAK